MESGYEKYFAIAYHHHLLDCDETITPAIPATAVATVPAADSIYLNGEIFTMQGDEPHYIDALAVKNGQIVKVGAEVEVLTLLGDDTQVSTEIPIMMAKALSPSTPEAGERFFNTGQDKAVSSVVHEKPLILQRYKIISISNYFKLTWL